MRYARRVEDMSTTGSLQVMHNNDGDVFVCVVGEDGASAGVEFCIPGTGGGNSPRTHAALIALLDAMQADNDAKERQP